MVVDATSMMFSTLMIFVGMVVLGVLVEYVMRRRALPRAAKPTRVVRSTDLCRRVQLIDDARSGALVAG